MGSGLRHQVLGPVAPSGALLVYDYDRFPPEKVLSLLEEVRATGMMAQPTVYRNAHRGGHGRYDLSSITNFAVEEKNSPRTWPKKSPAQTGARAL